jgi:RimJ/RimL family protein N-acetyltransferase
VVLGLSDHTRDNTVAIASVALGAKLIEKHFILDRSVGGPDAFFSVDPGELAALVRDVRTTSAALGRPRFGPSAEEVGSTAFRRSLFVSAPVKAGETFTTSNVRSVRPSNGLDPRYIGRVLGCVATRDIDAATPLAWDHVGERRQVIDVTLRLATADDADALLAWRNDPQTRAMSIDAAEVTNDQHRAWLAKTIEREDRLLFAAEHAGRAIGSVRLDAHGVACFEVSLTVAPAERGKGYAVALLRAAEAIALARGAVRLVAVIKPENTASRRAFEAAGFFGFVDHVERGVALHRCERRIAPYPQTEMPS